VTKQQTAAAALVSMIDELGDLEALVQPMRARIARIDTLRAALRGVYADKDMTACFTAKGLRFTCNVGAAGNTTVIDRAKLLKLLGPTHFAVVATVSSKAIKENCGPEILGAVSSTEQTGTRSLDIVPLAA
jgi:hypothetical protein